MGKNMQRGEEKKIIPVWTTGVDSPDYEVFVG